MQANFRRVSPGRWAPAAPLLLLLLFCHAFLVSATHFHRSALGVRDGGGAVLDMRDDAAGLPETGGHAQCLLCRLQRSFDADYQKEWIIVGAPRQASGPCELSPALSPVTRPFCVPSGRAPPSA